MHKKNVTKKKNHTPSAAVYEREREREENLSISRKHSFRFESAIQQDENLNKQ